ncbi:MAG: ribonuclease P protein component [Bacteroidota bacterium]
MLTLKKTERLISYSKINALFTKGKQFTVFPFKVIWNYSSIEQDSIAQVAISVPKRLHKKAVARNLIRRRSKEAYRLNKKVLFDLLAEKNTKIEFMMVYLDKNILPFNILNDKIKLIFERFKQEYEKTNK